MKPKSTSQNSPRVTRFERINELSIEKEERKSSQKTGILKDPNMSQLERLSMRSGNSVDFAEDQLDNFMALEEKKEPQRNTEENVSGTNRKEETSIRFQDIDAPEVTEAPADLKVADPPDVDAEK